MPADAGGSPKSSRFDPPLSEIRARQIGTLEKGADRWDVMLETVMDADLKMTRGRIHFVAGTTHRLSAWIYLEWAEKDVEERCNETSAHEWWTLLSSLSA